MRGVSPSARRRPAQGARRCSHRLLACALSVDDLGRGLACHDRLHSAPSEQRERKDRAVRRAQSRRHPSRGRGRVRFSRPRRVPRVGHCAERRLQQPFESRPDDARAHSGSGQINLCHMGGQHPAAAGFLALAGHACGASSSHRSHACGGIALSRPEKAPRGQPSPCVRSHRVPADGYESFQLPRLRRNESARSDEVRLLPCVSVRYSAAAAVHAGAAGKPAFLPLRGRLSCADRRGHLGKRPDGKRAVSQKRPRAAGHAFPHDRALPPSGSDRGVRPRRDAGRVYRSAGL